MKYNKKILLIIFIILILISIIFLSLNSRNNTTKKNNNDKETKEEAEELVGMNKTIIDAIENKKSINVYFTNNEGKINSTDDTVNTFKELYDVDIEVYNISKEGKKNLSILEKKLGFYKGFFGPKAQLYIKDGNMVGAYSNFEYEYDLYNHFKESNILKEGTYDMYIRTDETFDNIYNSNELQLMIVGTANSDGDKYRIKINELSKEYNFKYYVVFYHFGGAIKADRIFDNELRDKINVPAILVVKEGKVIDYNDSNKEESIKKFLKKNKFIK